MRTLHTAQSVAGYAEGYYGRLLSWPERGQILDALQTLSLNTYYYAPKEDPCHRLHWRIPYSKQWHADFQQFCKAATHRRINVVAGVAPGLDFNFAHLPDGKDFSLLVAKACSLLDAGASAISLLMDDIDADFDRRRGDFLSEGQAHASLANALALALSGESSQSIWVTPRIYADELMPEAPEYLPQFLQTLDEHHAVMYCGSDVVARTLNAGSSINLHTPEHDEAKPEKLKHRVVLWDNLYANDYCPRRLFVGPWQGRYKVSDVLLNPTGMVYTDCLLLELMADGLQQQAVNSGQGASGEGASTRVASGWVAAQRSQWRQIMKKHGVPDAFLLASPLFRSPGVQCR